MEDFGTAFANALVALVIGSILLGVALAVGIAYVARHVTILWG